MTEHPPPPPDSAPAAGAPAFPGGNAMSAGATPADLADILRAFDESIAGFMPVYNSPKPRSPISPANYRKKTKNFPPASTKCPR